ncbi:hypothetical protein [Listeria sp. SHR_NRA_18]|uniref:hypothetical protein n=1 Tax=Listeria sp. SHR_NRA_18 TaxID=2269046 RepID=UPI000F5EC29B|nr:hypothetical protein [Listeria sp. SHR_NRA_18]
MSKLILAYVSMANTTTFENLACKMEPMHMGQGSSDVTKTIFSGSGKSLVSVSYQRKCLVLLFAM